MSILIKGMEMPTSCWECHFGHGETGRCVVDFKFHGDWNEPQDCPLVPVPPHGRLLDESKIFEMLEVQREDEYNKTHRPKATWSRVMKCFEDLLGIVDTAIPAEEGET